MAKATAPKGKIETFKLAIEEVITELNSNDKVGISTEEGIEVNKTGMFQLSPKQLARLATKAGCADSDMMKNAIANSVEDCHLEVSAQHVKAGELVLNEKGEEIEDVATQKPMVYSKDHWRINWLNCKVILSDDAMDYVASINRAVDIEITRSKRVAKQTRKGRKTVASGSASADIAQDEDLDS